MGKNKHDAAMMRYLVIPTEDARAAGFSEDELGHMRRNADGSQVIVHEDTLLRLRAAMGLQTLPSEYTGVVEWTYPVYEQGSPELAALLASEQWDYTETADNGQTT